MGFSSTQVDVITVDSYGTLVDPSDVVSVVARYVEPADRVAADWRARSLMYTMIGNSLGVYQSFFEILHEALAYSLQIHDIELPQEHHEEIVEAYHELQPFDDVVSGLETIRKLGYPIYILSNGTPAMLESLVEQATIDHIIEDCISVDEIEIFKPVREVYTHAAKRTGTAIENIAHVAGPSFDVQGAKCAGMQGVWINRAGDPWEQFGPDPDLTIQSFHDLGNALQS